MASSVYTKLKNTGRLPSPTGVALQILKLAESPNTSAGELAEVIETDPATSARLLKLANSPLAGIPRQISSVSRAIVTLGIRTVKVVALGFSLLSNYRQGDCAGFDYQSFWSESLARAVVMRHLATLSSQVNSDEAFAVGLLSQIGRLAMATAFPDRYSSIAPRLKTCSVEERAAVEQEAFDIHPDVLSAEMMSDWGIPQHVCDSVAMQTLSDKYLLDKDPEKLDLEQLLRVSILLSHTMAYTDRDTEPINVLAHAVQHLRIDRGTMISMFEIIVQEWVDAGEIFDIQIDALPPLDRIYSEAAQIKEKLSDFEGVLSSINDMNGK